MKKIQGIRCLILFFVTWTQCYIPIANAQASDVPDFYPPTITHWVLHGVMLAGKSQRISAVVKDNQGVREVVLHFRTIGNSSYEKILMVSSEEPGLFTVNIPAHLAKAPGIEYFIEARDNDENITYKGWPDEPIKLAIESRPGALAAQSTDQPSIDDVEIFHQPSSDSIPSNQPFIVSANVSNADKVNLLVLFYRIKGESTFQSLKLNTAGQKGFYLVELPASELHPPGLEYYIQVEDIIGNTTTRGFRLKPLSVDIFESTSEILVTRNSSDKNNESTSSKTWLWVGLGVVGAALALSASKSGGSGSTNTLDDDGSDGEVTLIIPDP